MTELIDPLLPLDWRFQRAHLLHEAGKRPRRHDDVWVRRALAWLQRRGETGPKPSRPGKVDHLRAVSDAHALAQVDGLPRWRLEAWLLVEVPLQEVARRCSLSQEVVDASAALFFDVRSRLQARDWLCHRVLPPRSWLHGIQFDDIGSLLKLAALQGGPLVLEQALRVLSRPAAAADQVCLGLASVRDGCADQVCRFGLLLQALPVNAFQQPVLGVLQQLSRGLSDLQREIELICENAGPEEVGHGNLDAMATRLAGLTEIIDRLTDMPIDRAA